MGVRDLMLEPKSSRCEPSKVIELALYHPTLKSTKDCMRIKDDRRVQNQPFRPIKFRI